MTAVKKSTQTTLPKSVEAHLNANTLFNKFGIVNIATIRATTKTRLPDTELKKLIKNRFASEMVNGKIEFIGCDKYQIREIKEVGSSYFEIFDTDTEKTISDNFLSKNIPKGYGKIKNHFIKIRQKYNITMSYNNGILFTTHLNKINKKK